ncbi:hypothetical protein OEZ86_008126 [Tetradesmus obliquus]|nr:hypothetical protein OEZ86_008126 [Tetradesmus obliquus]
MAGSALRGMFHAWLVAALTAAAVVLVFPDRGGTPSITCGGIRCQPDVCRTPIGCDAFSQCQYKSIARRFNWTCPFTRTTGHVVTGLCLVGSTGTSLQCTASAQTGLAPQLTARPVFAQNTWTLQTTPGQYAQSGACRD